MASVGFQVVAGASVLALGPVGVIVGGILGAYIDNAFLMPFLFPGEEPEPETVSNLPISAFNEGGKLPRVYGPNARVDGQVIWASRPRYTVETTNVGSGKGGGGQKTTEITYTIDVAIAVGVAPKNPSTGVRAISSFEKILANGQDLFNAKSNLSPTSSLVAVAPFDLGYIAVNPKTLREEIWSQIGDSVLRFPLKFNRYTADSGSVVDFTDFKVGTDVVSSGFTNTENNVTGNVTKTELNGDNSTSLEVELGVQETITVPKLGGGTIDIDYPNYANVKRTEGGVTEAKGASVTFAQTIPTFTAEYVEDINFYDGSQTTTDEWISDLMETSALADDVPVYQDIAYFVIRGLILNNFGNSIPTFKVEVAAHNSLTVKAALESIYDDYEFPADLLEIDEDLASEVLYGFVIRGDMDLMKATQPLMLAYDIIGQETADAKLRLFQRTNAVEHEIELADFAVHEGDGAKTGSRPFETQRVDLTAQPSQVDVTYLNIDNNLEPSSESDRRLTDQREAIVQPVNLPLAMNAVKAKEIARRLLHVQAAESERISLKLPAKYLRIVENDMITFVYNGREYHALVSKIDRGANFLIELEASVVEPNALIQSASVDTRNAILIPGDPPNLGPATRLQVWDVPALKQADTDKVGFYLTANNLDRSQPWNQVRVESRNVSAAENYDFLVNLPDQATVGFATSEIGGWDDESASPQEPWIGGWDTINNVTVEMESGSLASASNTLLLNSMTNWAILGDEVIAFRDVTLTGTNTYKLEILLRGLHGTQAEINRHEVGDRFLVLSDPGVEFVDFGLKNIGGLYGFISGSDATNLAKASPQYATASGRTLGPRPHGWYYAVWFSGHLGLRFYQATRNFQDPFSQRPSDLRKWEIEVWNDDRDLLLNTYRVDASQGAVKPPLLAEPTDWIYTPSQINNDFLSAGEALPGIYGGINLTIYQVSDQYGRGEPRLITV